ncbi:MAG: hypothetical protein HYZ37_16340 [Candidatus Solibacter usitatus]|nr:hypothetical protein [Candidatus Solibacter usitatus]
MRCLYPAVFVLLSLQCTMAQDPGQGAPAGTDSQFLSAYFRGSFNTLTSLPAIGNVRTYGTGGYVQEFPDVKKDKANKFALVKGTLFTAEQYGIFQVFPAIYEYYTSVGVNIAGFPSSDTFSCINNSISGACTYQTFTRNYVLFSYPSVLTASDASLNYALRDPFFSRWQTIGGITGLGPAASAESTVTGKAGTTSITQLFANGALYSITSGASNGKIFAVAGKAFALYNQYALHAGSLGLPTSDALNAGGGKFRQNFEGGSIEYSDTTEAVIRAAVGAVRLSISVTAVSRMNLGESLTITATVYSTLGEELSDRQTSWVTSNGRIISIQAGPNGKTATLKAVGGGTATITAVSDGKASDSLTIFVAAPCCQIGEGSPTTAIQQAFQDAVTRLRLNVLVPVADPVHRAGFGYVQELQAADNQQQRYFLCRSDRAPGVFVVGGSILQAFEQLGGPAGKMGYPVSDQTAGGRQMFEGGALAGSPVHAVTAPILARWTELNFETGAAGPPIAPAADAVSFTGANGIEQAFRDGSLYRLVNGITSVPKATLVKGKILAAYLAADGPEGDFGFPINEEYLSDGLLRQDFEGTQLSYAGDGDVQAQTRQRRPQITAAPSKVVAGGRVRLIVGGFSAGANLRVTFNTQSNIPAFQIQTKQGSYTWEFPVAANAPTSTVTVTAQEVGTQNQASATYTVTAVNEAVVQLVKLRGDAQVVVPGARLASIAAALRDDKGTPLVGIAVKFTASPGAKVEAAETITDENGEAEAIIRTPAAQGIVLVTAEAAGKVVTFNARANSSTLTNYPRQMQTGSFTLGSSPATVGQKGALLAAASSVIRYHQSRTELPSSLGLSDPALLNSFLTAFCVLDTAGGRICDGYLTVAGASEPVVNLWRLKEFVGNNIDVDPLPASQEAIRDSLNSGIPVILALSLTAGGQAAGTHFVVANGINTDGAITIHDPNANLGRTTLEAYENGFSTRGREWKATLLSAIRLGLRSPSPTGFLVTTPLAGISVQGPNGECGRLLSWPNTAAVDADGSFAAPAGSANLYYCPGVDRGQIVQFASKTAFEGLLTDLGNPGKQIRIAADGAASYGLTRPSAQWQLDAIQLALSAADVVNAATFTRRLGPGTLAAIFGTGLGSPDFVPNVSVGGQAATVQSAGEFRLNVEIPQGVLPGEQILRIESIHGIAEVPITISEVAPAIFVDQTTSLPVILNATGNQRNTQFNPVVRGGTITVYATGLGPVRVQGTTRVTQVPVVVNVQGADIAASFAGLAAGFPGVYIVNAAIGQNNAPGLSVPLKLRQGSIESNVVNIAIR